MIFLEPFSKVLLFFHLIGTIVLAGSLTHNVIIVFNYCRGIYRKERLEKLYVKISFYAYTFVFLMGALVYPVFRIRVRAEYFDLQLPWATGLFEVKEHWAAIGWALFMAYFYMSKHFSPSKEKEKLVLYAPICFLIYIITLYLLWSGFYLTTLKAV